MKWWKGTVLGVGVLLSLHICAARLQAQGRGQDLEREASEHFEAGQNAHEAGDLRRAIESYDKALQLDENLWQAEYQRAMARLSLRQFDLARNGLIKVERRLVEIDQAGGGASIRGVLERVTMTLADCWRLDGQWAEASDSYRRAISRGAPAGIVHLALAEIALEEGKWQEAIREAKTALDAESKLSAQAWLVLGLASFELKREDDADEYLSKAIASSSTNLQLALRRRAEIRINRKQYDGAITDLRDLRSQGGDLESQFRLAWALWQNQQSTEALEEYRQILERDPLHRGARMATANLLIELGRRDEAIREFESLIKEEPARADLLAQLAELLVITEPERALELYLSAIRVESTKVSHRIGLGGVLVRMRRMAEAVPVLRQALEMGPDDDTIYYAHTNLGTALYELNDFAGALEEFRWILKHQQDPSRIPVTLYFLAICHDRLGQYEAALRHYDQFLGRATRANQLEIEKVQLRLPRLRKQIREGKGKRE
jgi:tetratricopeptide (TPR) repeat protein